MPMYNTMYDAAVNPEETGSPMVAVAEMGIWGGSQWWSGAEKRMLDPKSWRRAGKNIRPAFNNYVSSLRAQKIINSPQYSRNAYREFFKKRMYTPESAKAVNRGYAYSGARRWATRGSAWSGNLFSKAGWDAAKKFGVRRQMAMIATSRMAGLVFTYMNVAFTAPQILEGTKAIVTGLRTLGRQRTKMEFGEAFYDTEGTYTERQRAVRAISSSRMSIRSAIGGEAAMMHR